MSIIYSSETKENLVLYLRARAKYLEEELEMIWESPYFRFLPSMIEEYYHTEKELKRVRKNIEKARVLHLPCTREDYDALWK